MTMNLLYMYNTNNKGFKNLNFPIATSLLFAA